MLLTVDHRGHNQFMETIYRCAPEQRHGSWGRGKEILRRKTRGFPIAIN